MSELRGAPRPAGPPPASSYPLGPARVLLIATYELGRPSAGLAQPAAWLREAGAEVRFLDLTVEDLDAGRIRWADLLAFHLPMHTATRIALDRLEEVRRLNPDAHLCFYGLYAPPNETHLRERGAGTVLGGESEPGLVSLARRLQRSEAGPQEEPVISRARLRFRVPDRSGMPPLARYARLVLPDGTRRLAGQVEASRGCKHRCRHCPVVPVYDGTFRVVPVEVVLEDARRQVAAGARHLTFGDPDFLNGPAHAVRMIEALHRELPEITYDVTAKVEHLRRSGGLLPLLRRTGCLFVTTAAESDDDRVLELLDKGHTREEFEWVVRRFEETGIALAPTFLPFTPWTSVSGYAGFLHWLVRLDLVDRVAPVQLSIRLLLPAGSRLLELSEIRSLAGGLDPAALAHPWRHPDPAVDALHDAVREVVERGEASGAGRREIFRELLELASDAAGVPADARPILEDAEDRPLPPRISEPWYCCAEPMARRAASPEAGSPEREG